MSTSAHVYSDVYIIDVLYIFKPIKTLRYACFLTPVIFRQNSHIILKDFISFQLS